MEFILKALTPKMLQMMLPIFMTKAGNAMRNKDDNTTGTDDALGNIVIAMAPAMEAFDSENQSALRKSLEAVYVALGKYLGKIQ